MNNGDRNGPSRPRPRIYLEDCVAFGNGGDGFHIEGVDVMGKNLRASQNGGRGIVIIDSQGELTDPEAER
jgi:hypothetical protein